MAHKVRIKALYPGPSFQSVKDMPQGVYGKGLPFLSKERAFSPGKPLRERK